MKLSIRLKMIVILYAVAMAVAGLMCWIGADIVGAEIERRLVDDAVRNVTGMLKEMRLTPSSGVVQRLGEIVDAQLVVIDEHGALIGTSLARFDDGELKRLRALGQSDVNRLEMAGATYVVGSSDLTLPNTKTATVLLLKPAAKIDAARTRTTNRLLVGAAAALGLATVLILLLSISVTRPLRTLTVALDAASKRVTEEGPDALKTFDPPRSGSDETDRLSQAFGRLVDELTKAEDRVARLERLAAIGKVTASVVHEIRNPLSGMKMHLRLLRDEADITDDGMENLTVIEDELGRLELYVDELVVLAKSGKPAADVPPEPVNLATEIAFMVNLFSRKTEHANLTVRQTVAEELPLVSIAKLRLRQLIMNLFLNAIEACEPGATITFSGTTTSDGRVELIVADEGKGLGSVEGDIFDAFVSGKAHGGGLGLYVCRQIVHSYGGDICTLDQDTGAAFRIRLNSFDTDQE